MCSLEWQVFISLIVVIITYALWHEALTALLLPLTDPVLPLTDPLLPLTDPALAPPRPAPRRQSAVVLWEIRFRAPQRQSSWRIVVSLPTGERGAGRVWGGGAPGGHGCDVSALAWVRKKNQAAGWGAGVGCQEWVVAVHRCERVEVQGGGVTA